MEQAAGNKRLPVWKRNLAWLCFILLVLATPVSIVRGLMERSHQTAAALGKQKKELPKRFPGTGPTTAASHGIPLAEIPLIGVHAGDDQTAQKELQKQLEEISILFGGKCHVNGVLSFRAVLANMGMAVADTMTEAEAAAEFLKHVQRYSALLAQWRDAVGKGPWDFSALETKNSYTTNYKVSNVATTLQRLLGAIAEAQLRTGDTAGAWSSMQTMNSSADRNSEAETISVSWLWYNLMDTARSGMKQGAWTDDQLAAISTMMAGKNALAATGNCVELEKRAVADHLANFHENHGSIQEDMSRAKSPIGRMMSGIGMAITSDQQIADNLAVIRYQMERPLTRFDPETGFYLGESTDDTLELPRSKATDVSFDKFYYMYTEEYGGNFDHVTRGIIREQSAIDQTRIAAALELQRRTTGAYPESLDALGDSIPRDIATGQPYFYQRNSDGGYTLWGTGMDRTSESGNERSDVPYIHKPLRK